MYKEIDITDFHRGWVVHITPINNYDSIKKNGLIRPDILHANSSIEHTSPYDVFKTTNANYTATEEKNSRTYFGNMKNDTFKQWIKDPTVIDKCVGFILIHMGLLEYNFDLRGFGKFPSNEANIPFESLETILVISSTTKIEIEELSYNYILIVEDGKIIKLLYFDETQ